MKKLIIILFALLAIKTSNAQIFSFGLKGGVNSSKISFSDFSVDKAPTASINPDYYDDIAVLMQSNPTEEQVGQFFLDNPNAMSITSPKVSFEPSSYEMGFHFGAFARIKILAVFLQPELIFSQTNAAINMNPEGFDAFGVANQVKSSKVTYNNFDVPVLLGFKFGPAHICAGPVATFKLNSKIDDATQQLLKEIESDNDMDVFTVTKKATFGAQIGTGLTIAKKLTVDVRYEFGLSKLGDKVTIGEQEFKTDQRGNQFIGSIGWMF